MTSVRFNLFGSVFPWDLAEFVISSGEAREIRRKVATMEEKHDLRAQTILSTNLISPRCKFVSVRFERREKDPIKTEYCCQRRVECFFERAEKYELDDYSLRGLRDGGRDGGEDKKKKNKK